jgi:hypothetical protein
MLKAENTVPWPFVGEGRLFSSVKIIIITRRNTISKMFQAYFNKNFL